MNTLQVHGLSLAFADRDLLKNVSFTMDENTRAALAGANGSGKSTLLKIVSQKISADEVTISKTKGAVVSYLPQADIVLPEKSVYAVAEEGYKRFADLESEYNELSFALDEKAYASASGRMQEIQEILEDSGYWQRKVRISQILSGLGFKENEFSNPCNTFSGGWQMRVALARILVENPDFLLLDEPTNYLDIEAITFLKGYLKTFNGGVMVVSHDQDFLDETVDCVYELFKGKLTKYSGNYTTYLKLREEENERLLKAYKEQQEEIERNEQFIERFRYKATKSKQVQSRVKQLEKLELVEIPDHLKKLSFSFPPAPHSGNDVLSVENLHKAYGENVIYDSISFLVKKKERLAVTGRNGAGKSTLLRILAGVDSDYSGTVKDGAGVKKGYFSQDNENTLNAENTVLEELSSVAMTSDFPRLRSLLGSFLFFDDDVYKKVSVLSGGEKSRLSLLKILLHPVNLLILDEPTNHLDINAKDMLSEAVKAYDGTVIFVSHDARFIKNLATRILYLGDEGPEFFEGDYAYFEQKLEEKEAKYLVKTTSKAKPSNNHTDQKQVRNYIKKLEKENEALFAKYEEEQAELAQLEDEIARPENYTDAAKITKLVKARMDLEKQIEKTEEDWLFSSERLELEKGRL